MATGARNGARLNLRLPSDLKDTIEQAADQLGQTVTDFVVGASVRSAREVLHQRDVTELSNRDRDAFISALDNFEIKPNADLLKAARRYKKRIG